MEKLFKQEFEEAQNVLKEFMGNETNYEALVKAGSIMVEALKKGNKIISCGNGGSMCDAMHFAEELSGRFRNDRKALAAVSISDASHITCTANDYGFDAIFERYMEGLGMAGDVLLAISTSGNSVNVVKAAQKAREKNIKIVALTGNEGGKLAGLANVVIRAPKSRFSDRIQEIHIKVIHSMIYFIEENLKF
jgi:D-sedoheptulose 7-phosphate isomerase